MPSHRHFIAARLLPPLVAGVLLACAFAGLFTAAVHAPKPNDVRVAVVASQAAEQHLEQGLRKGAPGGFELVRYRSPDEARDALLDQDVSGVLVAGSGAPSLTIASAAGAPVADATRTAFSSLLGPELTVADARPLPAHDGRGLSTFFLTAGTTVASLLFGALLFILGRPLSAAVRVGALAAFGVVVGLALALMVDSAVGALTGAFFAVAGLAALLAVAVAAPTAALTQLLGAPGIGLSALVLMLLALPSSGGPIGAQLLPDFYAVFSNALPAGAALPAFRGAVYFDSAGITGHIAVLAAWALGGLLVEIAVGRRGRPLIGRELT